MVIALKDAMLVFGHSNEELTHYQAAVQSTILRIEYGKIHNKWKEKTSSTCKKLARGMLCRNDELLKSLHSQSKTVVRVHQSHLVIPVPRELFLPGDACVHSSEDENIQNTRSLNHLIPVSTYTHPTTNRLDMIR